MLIASLLVTAPGTALAVPAVAHAAERETSQTRLHPASTCGTLSQPFADQPLPRVTSDAAANAVECASIVGRHRTAEPTVFTELDTIAEPDTIADPDAASELDSVAELDAAADPGEVSEPANQVAPPAWRFVETEPGLPLTVPDQIRRFEPEILAAAEAHQIEPVTIAALISVESSGNPRAVSSAGALGLMQVMPMWFARGENPFDPSTNVMRGTQVFRQYLDELGDETLAFAAYLSGSNTIRASGGVPSFAMPYVRAVVAERDRYRAT